MPYNTLLVWKPEKDSLVAREESVYSAEPPRVDGEVLVIGGDGSYSQRGKWRTIPLANLREWTTSG